MTMQTEQLFEAREHTLRLRANSTVEEVFQRLSQCEIGDDEYGQDKEESGWGDYETQ